MYFVEIYWICFIVFTNDFGKITNQHKLHKVASFYHETYLSDQIGAKIL